MIYAKKRKLKIFHLNGISANFCYFIIGDLSLLLPEHYSFIFFIFHHPTHHGLFPSYSSFIIILYSLFTSSSSNAPASSSYLLLLHNVDTLSSFLLLFLPLFILSLFILYRLIIFQSLFPFSYFFSSLSPTFIFLSDPLIHLSSFIPPSSISPPSSWPLSSSSNPFSNLLSTPSSIRGYPLLLSNVHPHISLSPFIPPPFIYPLLSLSPFLPFSSFPPPIYSQPILSQTTPTSSLPFHLISSTSSFHFLFQNILSVEAGLLD